jgi:hypothetical protein
MNKQIRVEFRLLDDSLDTDVSATFDYDGDKAGYLDRVQALALAFGVVALNDPAEEVDAYLLGGLSLEDPISNVRPMGTPLMSAPSLLPVGAVVDVSERPEAAPYFPEAFRGVVVEVDEHDNLVTYRIRKQNEPDGMAYWIANPRVTPVAPGVTVEPAPADEPWEPLPVGTLVDVAAEEASFAFPEGVRGVITEVDEDDEEIAYCIRRESDGPDGYAHWVLTNRVTAVPEETQPAECPFKVGDFVRFTGDHTMSADVQPDDLCKVTEVEERVRESGDRFFRYSHPRMPWVNWWGRVSQFSKVADEDQPTTTDDEALFPVGTHVTVAARSSLWGFEHDTCGQIVEVDREDSELPYRVLPRGDGDSRWCEAFDVKRAIR